MVVLQAANTHDCLYLEHKTLLIFQNENKSTEKQTKHNHSLSRLGGTNRNLKGRSTGKTDELRPQNRNSLKNVFDGQEPGCTTGVEKQTRNKLKSGSGF